MVMQVPVHLRPTRKDVTRQPLLARADILNLRHYVASLRASAAESTRLVRQPGAGEAPSHHRGLGTDYEESRPYQPGDDPRFMNWRLTARTGEPFMKVFREPRRRTRVLVVDRRSAMRFGTRSQLKARQAAQIAGLLAFTAVKENMALGALLVDTHSQWIQPGGGQATALEIIHRAAAPCPPLHSSSKPSWGQLLKQLPNVLPAGSSAVLISDFLDLEPADRRLLVNLCRAHDVLAIQILDPAELQMPDAGPLSLTSPARSAQVRIDSSDPRLRAAYAAAAADYLAQRERLLRESGAVLLRALTDEPLADLAPRVLSGER
jgi:uncharacterized protein (DUF58 family)